MIYEATDVVTVHAVLAAAIKHSHLLGDFLDLVVREQYHIFNPILSKRLWDDYLSDCRGRDPEMPEWNESTRRRLRSSVFQALAQAGFIESTRTLMLQPVHIAPQVLRYPSAENPSLILVPTLPGRVPLGECVPHQLVPNSADILSSATRRPEMGTVATGISTATTSTLIPPRRFVAANRRAWGLGIVLGNDPSSPWEATPALSMKSAELRSAATQVQPRESSLRSAILLEPPSVQA